MNSYLLLEKNINDYVKPYADYISADIEDYQINEGYKYHAIATFQKNFNLDAKNLVEMFESALSDAGNLIQSGSYYPKNMLIEYLQEDPSYVRGQFEMLLHEDGDIRDKIDLFRGNIESRFGEEGKNSYFDYRFISFFLAAYNPEQYIYTKFTEYKDFANSVGYDLNITGSDGDRYVTLSKFACLVRDILKANSEFLEIHDKVTHPFEYKDDSLSWGTTDFIFNVSRRIQTNYSTTTNTIIRQNNKLEESKSDELGDMYVEEDIVETENALNKEEIQEKAKSYVPSGKPYVEKYGSTKQRRDCSSQKERIKILEDYSCQVCGVTFEYINSKGNHQKYIHVDHIIEKSDGGTEEYSNLWTLCPNCHTKKTLGIITIDLDKKKVYERNKEVSLHHDNHLFNEI